MQTLQPTDKDYWKQIVASSNRMGLELLPLFMSGAPTGNVVFSPTSIFVVLSMLYNGACSNTYVEIANALSLPSDSELNPWMRQLINFINGHKHGDLEVQLVNSFWFGNREALHFDFANAMAEVYSASLYGVDFASPDAVERINGWVAKSTRGKISKVFDFLPTDTRFVVSNAIYFLGQWEQPFRADSTRDGDFYTSGGGSQKARFMSQADEFNYYEDSEYQSVVMPYRAGNYAMHIVLPRKVLPAEIALPQVENLMHKTFAAPKARVELTMPKFQMDFRAYLQDALAQLGIFDLIRNPDLARIGNNLAVNAILHQAVIKVDELGTEAAAVTMGGDFAGAGLPQQSIRMSVDHPFIYTICDRMTGQILFLGSCSQPA